ncbi:MAG: hypothetical protein OFPII_36620 [Osedax symbiont Rs1]|nr:MAG: hypothetical protein OFPII_36620 [Osedax symbiont Rs1]
MHTYPAAFISLICLLYTSPLLAKEFKISTIDACPYMCQDKPQKGYVIDLLNEIFKGEKASLKFVFLPWNRAIRLANLGEISMVLAPTKKEAPSLNYPTEAIGTQRECFITRADSHWEYVSDQSLKNSTTIIPYGWGHIDQLKSKFGQPTFDRHITLFEYDENYYSRAILMLEKGRATAMFADPVSLQHYLKLASKKQIALKNVGCISTSLLYIGISPHPNVDSAELAALLDSGIRALRLSGKLASILQEYNLSDWKDEQQ